MCLCRNSIGSSIVMMCSSRVALISSIIAASVVDLPEPVGPVTSTKPRGLRVNSCTIGGRPSSSIEVELEGDQAEGGADRAALVVGVDAEAGVAGDRVGEVELPVGLQALALVAGEDRVDDLARVGRATASGSPRAARGGRGRAPSGCAPALRCRSEARRLTTSSSRSAKSMSMRLPIDSIRAATVSRCE